MMQDVSSLASLLPDLQAHIKYPTWNHLDFTWGEDATPEVYQKIIGMIRKQHKGSSYSSKMGHHGEIQPQYQNYKKNGPWKAGSTSVYVHEILGKSQTMT